MRALLPELRAAVGLAVTPAFTVVVWLLFAGIAAAIAFHGHGQGTIVLSACVFGSAALLGGFVLGVAVPPLLADARTLCLPGRLSVLSYAGRVVIGFAIASILLPGLWLGVRVHSLLPAVGICGAALAGLLIPRHPRVTSVALWVVILAQARGPSVGRWLSGAESPWLEPRNDLLLAFAALAGLTLWTWLPILRGQPAALEAAASWGRRYMGRGEAQALAQKPDASFAHVRPGRRRGSAALWVRVLLGPPFAPMSLLLKLRMLAGLAVVAGGLAAWVSWRFSWHSGWRVGIIGWLMFTAMSYAVRLPVLRNLNGERAELALLPGLGEARRQRRNLYRACLGGPLVVAAAAVVPAAAAALAEGDPVGSLLAAGFWLASTLLLGASYIAAVLAGSQAPRVYGAATVLLAAALAIWWLNGSAYDLALPHRLDWLVYLPAAWATLALVIYLRRLASYPHPLVLP
jgi:hypothetical protein